ncbi:hypothetical protein ACPOL_0407 [Acidisarcina polymorpha]|uniref:Uncharacterized protein n=1 Tax=Acidisarcina polymorpha TaxID=2211140 RepID=A0A2Z5FTG2_9BACT|nr:hypothetical protein ACPOL_0407 [Acidisarcina polymorpha]
MYMAFASVSAPELSQADTIVGSQDPRIRTRIHAGGHQRASGALQQCSSVDLACLIHAAPEETMRPLKQNRFLFLFITFLTLMLRNIPLFDLLVKK